MLRPLLDERCFAEVARGVAEAASLLVFLDYDGTLTPIVEHPSLANLEEPMRQTIRTLQERADAKVAIISGRALGDVQARVGIDGLVYAGNHGLEIKGPGGLEFLLAGQGDVESQLTNLAAQLQGHFEGIPGVLVENKRLTSSVHYRQVPEDCLETFHRLAQQAFAQIDSRSLCVTTGNKVYEIRPRVDWDKGKACLWIQRQLKLRDPQLMIYLGDDRTDEDAFEALAPDAITIKVESSPGESKTKARYSLQSPRDVRHFLEWLASRR